MRSRHETFRERSQPFEDITELPTIASPAAGRVKGEIMSGPAEDFMTVDEVAAVLKVNQQTVRNWITAGKLPAVHIGRRVRIRRQDFERIANASSPLGPSPPGPKRTGKGQAFWEGRLITEGMLPGDDR